MKRKSQLFFKFSFFALLFLGVVAAGLFYGFYKEFQIVKSDLRNWQNLYERQVLAAKSGPFTNSGEMPAIEHEKFVLLRDRYIEEKRDFIAIDLVKMELTIFSEGTASATLKVLRKGREGGPRETPSGNYEVISKERNHLSSIAKVWMPWSVWFYGNYFIHGPPRFPSGAPADSAYSSGCVSLSDEDAKLVYDFAKKGMPVLVTDQSSQLFLKAPLQAITADIAPLPITAKSALVYDFSGDEPLLDFNSNDILPMGSLGKLITALTGSEVIYLGRLITIQEYMLSGEEQSYELLPSERYEALELLSPIISRSSNGASRALASFLGEKLFMDNVAAKIKSLEMGSTKMSNSASLGQDNVSTASDLTKLLKYIIEKRSVILEISKTEQSGLYELGAAFQGDSLLGGITAYSGGGEGLVSTWKLKLSSGEVRTIGIIFLGSQNIRKDMENVLAWLNKSFGLK
ncbi:MAG: L,D-transpeptidase family protein [Candidatus Liptonbacteria bacterium]|nr:L,D-transpeptidase family protein [Candidatus Liptonbacteria bacterium]